MSDLALLAAFPAIYSAVYSAVGSHKQGGSGPGSEVPLYAMWLTTTRTASVVTLEYLDTIDAMLEPDPVVRRRNWHERRRVRFRESLARQLAMPAPRLP